jgi:hypothetical protein
MILLGGCSKGDRPADLPKLYQHSLTIIQDGTPLEDAKVFLLPSDGSKWNASGTTDKNGVAVLYTQGLYKGVTEGTYKLSVQKTILETTKKSSSGYVSEDVSNSTDSFYSLIDMKYIDMQNTPLEIVITPKKENFQYDLGPAVKQLIPNEPG